jgi:multiple sugar transport system permease protein
MVPAELEAAAKIDGCTQWSAFWRVILPPVRPGLVTVAAFAFLIVVIRLSGRQTGLSCI